MGRRGNEMTAAHSRCWAAGDHQPPAPVTASPQPSQLATSPRVRALSFPGDGALPGPRQPGLRGPCAPLPRGLPSPSPGLTQEHSLPRLLNKHEQPRDRQTSKRPGLRRESLGSPLCVGARWHEGCPHPRGARRGRRGRALVAAAWVLRPRDQVCDSSRGGGSGRALGQLRQGGG